MASEVATCKRALTSPFTVDSRAVQLSLDPFDNADPYKHQQSLVKSCVALPYDLRTDQKKMEIVPCNECTYGFQEVDQIKSLVCSPPPFKVAPGNNPTCTTCLFDVQNPSTLVDCNVCIQNGRENAGGMCECIM